MPLVIACIAAAAVFLFCLGLSAILRARAREKRDRVAARLSALAQAGPDVQALDIVRRRVLSEVPWFHRLLAGLDWAKRFDATIRQAAVKGSTGLYVLAAALLALCGFYLALLALKLFILALAAGALLGLTPFAWVLRRKRQRMGAFQRQLPDALDLIARALKAGSTLSGGMRMVADECNDPIGAEFAATLDEINFGVDVDRAMQNLLARVDCPDLKFFVVSVNIQRETGGNLAEIVGNTAQIIRERFKLLGRIRVLSAEGRLSAIILLAMPFVIALVIYLINPGYMSVLAAHPLGRIMAYSALGMMGLGAVIIRKMIAIKV